MQASAAQLALTEKLVWPLHKGLTLRERDVALLVERNLSNDEIARKLGIGVGTVKTHVHKILLKHGLTPRPRRSITAGGRERIREAQRRRWQHWRAARFADNT